jgi:hypothetical protein
MKRLLTATFLLIIAISCKNRSGHLADSPKRYFPDGVYSLTLTAVFCQKADTLIITKDTFANAFQILRKTTFQMMQEQTPVPRWSITAKWSTAFDASSLLLIPYGPGPVLKLDPVQGAIDLAGFKYLRIQ